MGFAGVSASETLHYTLAADTLSAANEYQGLRPAIIKGLQIPTSVLI